MATIENRTLNEEIIEQRAREGSVVYPVRDGKPLGEDEVHIQEIVNCIQFLQSWYQHRQDVYVMGNNFVYWHEGHPKKRVSPDCYVVFGVEKCIRHSYKSWEEGGTLPSVVFEFTSKSTRQRDTGYKFNLYEQVWNAQEYFLFDPLREYLASPFLGYTLSDGRYIPMPLTGDRIYSEQLGLEVVVMGRNLRFFDPVAGKLIPTLAEAEAENASMRAELAALRRKYGEGT